MGLSKKPVIPNGDLIENGFIKVTELNRKKCIIVGRILYLIKKEKKTNLCTGFMVVSPMFKIGWNYIPYFPWDYSHPYVKRTGSGHWKFYSDEDQDYNKWIESNKMFIETFGINKNQLYIKLSDPILQFKHEIK